jgi:hypothetical protein
MYGIHSFCCIPLCNSRNAHQELHTICYKWQHLFNDFSCRTIVPLNHFCTCVALLFMEFKLTVLFSSTVVGYTSSFAPCWHWILSTLPFCLVYGQSATSYSNSAHWHPYSCLPVLQTHIQEQVQSTGTHQNGPWIVNKITAVTSWYKEASFWNVGVMCEWFHMILCRKPVCYLQCSLD